MRYELKRREKCVQSQQQQRGGRRLLRTNYKSLLSNKKLVFPRSADTHPLPAPSYPPFLEMEKKVQKKPIRLMAAVCNEMGMGKDGTLPWSLPSEFQYFLDTITTVKRPGNMNLLIWGRLCWISHPESMLPLANSLHVVLSTTLSKVPDHAHFLCQDFESAVRLASEPPLADIIETIWIIGGTRVYEDALKHPWCDLIYLTDVMADFDCDVFFPEFDRELFKVQESFPDVPSEIQEENGIKFKCQVFKRVTADSS